MAATLGRVASPRPATHACWRTFSAARCWATGISESTVLPPSPMETASILRRRSAICRASAPEAGRL